MNGIAIARILRRGATAAWIGGQLFGVVALPRAARSAARWRDRRRILARGWEAWAPVALGAMTVATAAALVERGGAAGPAERRRARLRTGSALLGLASTSAATVLGELVKRHRVRAEGALERDEAGVPVALSRRTALERGMVPLNVLHALGAAGLLLGD